MEFPKETTYAHKHDKRSISGIHPSLTNGYLSGQLSSQTLPNTVALNDSRHSPQKGISGFEKNKNFDLKIVFGKKLTFGHPNQTG